MANETEKGIQRRKIPDRLVENRFTRMPASRIPTERATIPERRIIRRSEEHPKAYTDPIAIAAGTIIRSAVDIGRYERTLRKHPELTSDQRAHVARMISCASVHATICANNLAAESSSPMAFMSEVAAAVASVDWETAPDAKIPAITSQVPADDTEYPHHIAFYNQVAENRAQIPA